MAYYATADGLLLQVANKQCFEVEIKKTNYACVCHKVCIPSIRRLKNQINKSNREANRCCSAGEI